MVAIPMVCGGCINTNDASTKTQLAVASQLSEAEQQELIAKIGDVKITLADLERRLSDQSTLLRGQYGNSQRKIGFLMEWVRLHLLANEGSKLGLENHDEVRYRLTEALVEQLLEDLARDELRNNPMRSQDTIETTEGASSEALEEIRLSQQAARLSHKTVAVEALLKQYGDQRKVSYNEGRMSVFKTKIKKLKEQ